MSAAATTVRRWVRRQARRLRQNSAWKNLRGLFPYLRSYTGANRARTDGVALMGIVGNVLPLAIGLISDVLAGSHGSI